MKTHYFVCLSLLLILTDIVRCESDYSLNCEVDGWLKLHKTPKVWMQAFDTCHEEGAVLASPLNKELANALLSQMAQSGVIGKIFLGIHDFFSKGVFTSIEGVPLSDMDIIWGAPGNGSDTGHYLSMSANGNVYYHKDYPSAWGDPLPYICYKKMNKCGTFDNKYRYNQQTGSCYKIYSYKMTWSSAYSKCASEGAHLVILNDAEEARIVKDMFPPRTGTVDQWDGFHIGLVKQLGFKHNWITIHGENIEDVYNKWKPGQPDAYFQEYAVALWDGYLDNIYSSSEHMFACEKSPIPKRTNDVHLRQCAAPALGEGLQGATRVSLTSQLDQNLMSIKSS